MLWPIRLSRHAITYSHAQGLSAYPDAEVRAEFATHPLRSKVSTPGVGRSSDRLGVSLKGWTIVGVPSMFDSLGVEVPCTT